MLKYLTLSLTNNSIVINQNVIFLLHFYRTITVLLNKRKTNRCQPAILYSIANKQDLPVPFVKGHAAVKLINTFETGSDAGLCFVI
jgi:hypothetical protein